ncbi:hypothetical protein WN51_04766 [Melipona quadrifasciata]|uniref:Uncharacterized protein n=1 Tax=Melipona quadrifasciata TaxID=166423 RepID=A0A0M8ZVB9_9HYME|nr:hypothetical protein WN51_04766 [Melipona quadrifasciata]
MAGKSPNRLKLLLTRFQPYVTHRIGYVSLKWTILYTAYTINYYTINIIRLRDVIVDFSLGDVFVPPGNRATTRNGQASSLPVDANATLFADEAARQSNFAVQYSRLAGGNHSLSSSNIALLSSNAFLAHRPRRSLLLFM